MDSLNHDNQANVIEAINLTSGYLNDLLNIDNPYFEGLVKLYLLEQQLNKAIITDTETPFFRLTSLYWKWICFRSKIYEKRNDFDFWYSKFSRFWMVTFLAVLLIVVIFHNLLGLLESAIMLRTSMGEI